MKHLLTIGHNLGQGQVAEAQVNFAAFEGYGTNLEQECMNCHATPRQAFVSGDVDALVTALGVEMGQVAPDPATAGILSGQIGGASCDGCHNVHFPAQKTRSLWGYVATPAP